jgi:hypothetical protein
VAGFTRSGDKIQTNKTEKNQKLESCELSSLVTTFIYISISDFISPHIGISNYDFALSGVMLLSIIVFFVSLPSSISSYYFSSPWLGIVQIFLPTNLRPSSGMRLNCHSVVWPHNSVFNKPFSR